MNVFTKYKLYKSIVNDDVKNLSYIPPLRTSTFTWENSMGTVMVYKLDSFNRYTASINGKNFKKRVFFPNWMSHKIFTFAENAIKRIQQENDKQL